MGEKLTPGQAARRDGARVMLSVPATVKDGAFWLGGVAGCWTAGARGRPINMIRTDYVESVELLSTSPKVGEQ